jgi:hypothetical protein
MRRASPFARGLAWAVAVVAFAIVAPFACFVALVAVVAEPRRPPRCARAPRVAANPITVPHVRRRSGIAA